MADDKKEAATAEEPKGKAKGPAVCGHENKHYIAPKEIEGTRLFCTLPKDHEGDHQSAYQILSGGVLKDSVAYWSDAAGVPVKK